MKAAEDDIDENEMIRIIEQRDNSKKEKLIKYIQNMYLNQPNELYTNLLGRK